MYVLCTFALMSIFGDFLRCYVFQNLGNSFPMIWSNWMQFMGMCGSKKCVSTNPPNEFWKLGAFNCFSSIHRRLADWLLSDCHSTNLIYFPNFRQASRRPRGHDGLLPDQRLGRPGRHDREQTRWSLGSGQVRLSGVNLIKFLSSLLTLWERSITWQAFTA